MENIKGVPLLFNLLQSRVIRAVIQRLPLLEVHIGVVDKAAVKVFVGQRAIFAVHLVVEPSNPLKVVAVLCLEYPTGFILKFEDRVAMSDCRGVFINGIDLPTVGIDLQKRLWSPVIVVGQPFERDFDLPFGKGLAHVRTLALAALIRAGSIQVLRRIQAREPPSVRIR